MHKQNLILRLKDFYIVTRMCFLLPAIVALALMFVHFHNIWTVFGPRTHEETPGVDGYSVIYLVIMFE